VNTWFRLEGTAGWLNSAHVTRIFPVHDAVKGWQVCASVSGPQRPFMVASGLASEEDARQYAENTVFKLMGPR
jgi:hypothetical protein